MAGNEIVSAPTQTSTKSTCPAPIANSKTGVQVASNIPTRLESCFTKSQFALALVIQRSKPEGVSVIDYCSQLRKNIQNHYSINNKINRYVDTCEFWKDQYTKIYKEKQTLQDKLSILEEIQQAQPNSASSNTDNKIIVNEHGKRPSLFDEVQEILDKPEEETPSGETSVLRLCRYVLQIGQRRARLEKIIKESDALEHLDNLVSAASQVISLLEIALDECITPLWALKCGDDARIIHLLQQLMRQVALGFRICFNALNELCRTIIGRSKRIDTVYRLATFFKKALDHLHTLCTLQTEHENKSRRNTRQKRAKTDAEYAANKYLSQALISISQLEWKVGGPGHNDILEGILFSILAHTGRLVSNAVFDEHVAVSDKVGHITTKNADTASPDTILEARYFIPILREAIGTSSNRRELVSRVLSGSRRVSSNQSQAIIHETPDHDILTKARKRLQETLVKYAVGGEEFNSLAMPEQPEHLEDAAEPTGEVEKYSREWLLESVWGIVGWELAL